MKRIKIYVLLLIGSLMASCNAVDLGAEDTYSLDNFWKTPEQCERYMINLHSRIRDRQENFLLMGEHRGGTFATATSSSVGQGTTNIPIVSNLLSITNPGITTWGGFYNDIYPINHAIDKIQNECAFLSDQARNNYLGMLYGMRAYYYFHLLRTWGGVPLCDQPDVLLTDDLAKLDKPRATEQETWQFIRNDVDRSMAAYKDLDYTKFKNKVSYWNKGATVCLMAEVYLWGAKVKPLKGSAVFSSTPEQDLKDARTALLEAKAKYSPNTKFADAFSTINKDANKETIFALRFRIGEASTCFAEYTYPPTLFTGYVDATGKGLNDPIKAGGGGMRYEYATSFYNSIPDEDPRKAATFFPFFKVQDAKIVPVGRFLYKFIGEMNGEQRNFTNDWPIYRYMDIALMLAEISNELNAPEDVKTYIEECRGRAYGKTNMPVFTYTNKEAAEEAILQERDIEFVAEGKRWYDVRRMLGAKYALQLVSNNELKLVWPIDATTLSRDSKVVQNEGYR